MQLEYTYDAADVRESLLPEAYAAHPEKYGRRWVRPAFMLALSGLLMGVTMWLAGLTPDLASFQTENLPHDLRTESLPAFIPAFYVCAMYLLTIWKTWRSARARGPTPIPPSSWMARMLRMSIGFICGIGIWMALSSHWDPIWYPSRKQLVWVNAAPWLAVILLMQVLGAVQRRGKLRGQWLNKPGLRRQQTVVLDEGGFHTQDTICRCDFAWAHFKRARETKNLLILTSENGAQYLIPKRAFADPLDIERCRSLLQNVITNTRFLVKPSGFAVLPKPVLPVETPPQIGSATGGLTPPTVPMTIPPSIGTGTPT